MATYYVDGTLGTDDGSHGTGTGTDAWATLTYAMQSGGLAHGDTVNVAAGTYDEGGIFPAISGDASSGAVVFAADGAVTWNQGAATSQAIRLGEADYMEFQGFTLTDSHANDTKFFLVNRSDSDHLKLTNCTLDALGIIVSCNQAYAITVELDGCTIKNNTVGTPFNYALLARANTTIQDCAVFDGGRLISGEGHASITVDGCVVAGMSMGIFSWGLTSPNCVVSITNNAFTVGGTGFSASHMAFYAANGEYFRDNPANWTYEGNRVWCLDDPATWTGTTFDTIISPTTSLPLPTGPNWFADIGVTEAQIAAGTVTVSGTTFGAPNNILEPNTVMLSGDSICVGEGADDGYKCWQVLSGLIGGGLVADGDDAALGGINVRGMYWFLDVAHANAKGRVMLLAVGINDIANTTGALLKHRTAVELAEEIEVILEKHRALGGVAGWVGIGSAGGDPIDNTNVDAANAAVEAYCQTHGIPWASWLDDMRTTRPADWDTYYYATLAAGGIHPDNDGHALIAELAYELWLQTTASWQHGPSVCIGIGL